MDDKQIVENLKQEHAVKSKSDYPSEMITLPSKGYFYPVDHPLASGEIELKYPTAREEDILTSKNLITKGLAIDTFLKAIIMTPMEYNSLLLGDKNGIMFASRILAYGPDYPVKMKCPSCSEVNNITLDLSELGAKEINFEEYPKGENEFETELPSSKKKVKFRLLTHEIETAITEEIKKTKKKIAGMSDAEVTTRLKHAIVSIDGDDSRGNIWKFVDSMLSRDSLFLRGQIMEVSPDIDSVFDFVCAECGHSDEVNVPMEVSFFWPSGKL
jgi:phage FluMu protein Com